MATVISTAQVDEPSRFAYWNEAANDVFVKLDMSRVSPLAFAATMKVETLEHIQISTMQTDPQHVVRSARHASKAEDDYFLLSLQLQDSGYVQQDGREARLAPGDLALYDTTRPYVLHFERPFRQTVFRFPRSLLLKRMTTADSLTSIRLSGSGHPVSATLSSFLQSLALSCPYFDPAAKMRMADSAIDLLAAALSVSVHTAPDELHAPAEVHYRTALSVIDRNLNDPRLSPDFVAGQLNVSLRHAQKLFADRGGSLAAHIRARRLECCRRDLSDPGQLRRSVTDIAFAWGFNDAAHFSRLFKRSFGDSPTEFRAAAVRKAANFPR
ncbi:helix-turn-helix domain-containing protein [Saccharibacillus sacchari]|uniref:Helix-turn-helix domain-containing protein n=1 Tax=Saccharibacillus sacchari TaxID=456493 RepID=A0ACC6PDW3_9BACL